MPCRRLLAAYAATAYEAAGVAAFVGRRSPGVDALLAAWGVRCGAFVAPGNPLSRRMPPGWNRRRMAALAVWLRRAPAVSGWGRGRGWAEPHILAAIAAPRALRLARRFRQAAIVVVRLGRPAQLLTLR